MMFGLNLRSKAKAKTYTDKQIDHAVASASRAVLKESAVAVAVAGLYRSAFASAVVNHPAVTVGVMAKIGWELIRRGEFCAEIVIRSGRVSLVPVSEWTVRGTEPDPQGWMYELQTNAPDGVKVHTRLVSSAAVVHLMFAQDAVRQWVGVSPLDCVAHSAVCEMDCAVAQESKSPRGSLLPMFLWGRGDEAKRKGELLDARAKEISRLAGGALIQPVDLAGLDAGYELPQQSGADAFSRWQQKRIGYQPPQFWVEQRASLADAVCAAARVPPGLVSGELGSTGRRESLRQWLHIGLEPLAREVAAELALKLDEPNIEIDFHRIFASDLAGRARAYKQLRESDLTEAEALAICGFDTETNN